MKITWYRYEDTYRVDPPITVQFNEVTSREGAFEDLLRVITEDFEPWITEHWPEINGLVTLHSWPDINTDFKKIQYIEDTFSVNMLYGIPMWRDRVTGKLTFID